MLCASASALVPDTIPGGGGEVQAAYKGTNLCDAIGLNHAPALEGAWQLPFNKKGTLR